MHLLTRTVGRALFALPFALFGVNHLINADKMSGMVPSFMPGGGVLWVQITGAALLLASLAIIVNYMGRLASFGIAAFLLAMIVTVQIPGLINAASGEMVMRGINMLKDIALFGAALVVAGITKNMRG